MESLDLVERQLLGQLNGRDFRLVQNLVRVRVANSAENVRIRQRSLHGVIFACQSLCKLVDRHGEDVDTARIEFLRIGFA